MALPSLQAPKTTISVATFDALADIADAGGIEAMGADVNKYMEQGTAAALNFVRVQLPASYFPRNLSTCLRVYRMRTGRR